MKTHELSSQVLPGLPQGLQRHRFQAACGRHRQEALHPGSRTAWRGSLLLFLLTVLGLIAAAQAADYEYKVENGTVTITKYTGAGGAVTIPDMIGGRPVTSIGDSAFYGCTGLTSVVIGNSVTSIGGAAFYGCTGLTSVVIGNSVTWIGDGAFDGCTGLTSITIPDSVTSIGDSAFSGCTGLTSVVIGNSVTSIGSWAFLGCTGLTTVTIGKNVTSLRAFGDCIALVAIEVNPGNPVYSSISGVVFDNSLRTLVICPRGKAGTYAIPDSVTSIGASAFSRCSGLTSVTIPDSVTSIGNEAFRGCSGLRSVYFQGNAPSNEGGVMGGTSAVVYYLPGTTGWGPTFDGHIAMAGHGAALLEIDVHPAIRVTGEVGATYVIESKDGADDDFWLTRGWVELSTPTAPWTDPVPADSPRRVYRAVKVMKPTIQAPANMVWIPPGRFTMGSPEDERGRPTWEEGPQTRVTLTKGFWMGKYEVRQREYLAVMGSNPSRFQPPYYPEDLDWPVEQVSWEDAVAYCQKLTEQERTAGRLPIGYAYRLPTEAEWEYACRAGTTTRFSFGDALECGVGSRYCALPDLYMWWYGNGGPARVGQKLPNPWGLYDMHGNVWEWCRDLLDPDYYPEYSGGAVVDPQGPAAGSGRAMRGGGSWVMFGGSVGDCRSARRHSPDPETGRDFLGFRVLLAPGQ